MALEYTINVIEADNPYLLSGNSFFQVLGWRSQDSLWWWKNKLDNKYYLSTSVGQFIKGSASRFTTSVNATDTHNGNLVWKDSNDYSLWYNGTSWIISKRAGYDCYEVNDENEGWIGSDWYSCSTITGTYTARGSNHGNASITLSWDTKDCWQSDTEYGEYSPIGNAVGTKVVGFPIYKDGNNEWCLCGLTGGITENTLQTISGTAPNCVYIQSGVEGAGWYINGQNPLVGYWKRLNEDPEGTYTRTYTGTGTAPTPEQYTLTLDRYVKDNGTPPTIDMYIGQIGIWL